MNNPIIPAMSSGSWYTKEYDLGLILAGQGKDFNLSLFNTCLIKNLLLSASTAGFFQLTIYSRQAREIQDIIWLVDSSDTSQITRNQNLMYNDLDVQNQFYVTINNGSSTDINYKLVVKYG